MADLHIEWRASLLRHLSTNFEANTDDSAPAAAALLSVLDWLDLKEARA